MANKSKNTVMRHKALAITFFVAVVGFLWAVSYLFRWQIIRGEELKTAAMDQQLYTTTLSANRGTIYDATGTKILAQTASVWTVVLEPNYIDEEDKVKIATGLSEILEMDYDEVMDKVNQKSYFTYLKRKIETEIKDKIVLFLDENDIDRGVRFIEDYKRYYPYGTTASTVLGFTGTDNTGLAGLELYYEEELSGTAGRMVSAKNALGTDMPFQYEQLVAAEDGYDLVLTIDETVQSIMEKHLDAGCEAYEVKNGAVAILMEVDTGAIIGLAVSGDFDPNDPFTVIDKNRLTEIEALPEEEQDAAYNAAMMAQWRNKAVSDTYNPGSVFKMMTAAMALDSGAITEGTTFTCTGSYVPLGADEKTDKIGCWVNPGSHGTIDLHGGLCGSCNPYFMQVAETMGPDIFYKYYQAFGLTTYTDIDLPGEAIGYGYTAENMGPVELATESFGQALTVTPIQMITACSSVVNGGYVVQPHVVDRILDSEGNIVSSASTEPKRQVVSEDVSQLITSILAENVVDGGGKNAYVAGYSTGGKTGTSEKIAEWREELANGNEGALMQYIASFCGVAPANDPKYALLVFFDEPNRDTASGGGQAAPVFANIMTEVLPYLGIEKDMPVESENSVAAPDVVGKTAAEAKTIINEAGLYWDSLDELKDDAVIQMQVPAAGTTMPEDGGVVIFTDTAIAEEQMCTVPDFAGWSLADCNYLANIEGVQILITGPSLDGDLKAQSQDISPGSLVKPGTVITVNFVDSGAAERN